MKRNPSINVTLVKEKMTDPPRAQRLYDMIYGDANAMTKSQIKEVVEIVKGDHKELLRHLRAMIKASRDN